MIFIPNKNNKKLGFTCGKGIDLEKKDAERFEKMKFGKIKKVKKAGRPAKN